MAIELSYHSILRQFTAKKSFQNWETLLQYYHFLVINVVVMFSRMGKIYAGNIFVRNICSCNLKINITDILAQLDMT